jgi:hypothetical protein
MYAEVRNALHSDKITKAAKTAAGEAAALTAAVAASAVGGRSLRDAEVAYHYNSGLKFGVAGSDGTFWSNYYRHTCNNHELLSLFMADKRNPYDRTRRWFVVFSKLSLSLLLAAAFSSLHADRYNSPGISVPLDIQFGDSFIISLILCPYGYILNNIASCRPCTRANCCVRLVTSLSYCTLLIIASISTLFLIGGILIAVYILQTQTFLRVFIFSLLLDYASYFYYGIWNWYLISWEGFLCIPVFPMGEHGFPGRFLPVYAFWPLKKLLELYGLCKSTYVQDRAAFQKQFPGRVAVDSDGTGVTGRVVSEQDDEEEVA